MKKKAWILRLALLMLLFALALAVPALADYNMWAESYYEITVVQTDSARRLEDYYLFEGVCTGLDFYISGDGTRLVLYGAPLIPGDYYFDVLLTYDDGGYEYMDFWVYVDSIEVPEPEPTLAPPGSGTDAFIPVPGPSITKHPSGETVTAGSSTYFVARANNVSEIVWRIVMPDGSGLYEAQYAHHEISGLNVTGQGTETLSLANIPLEMDGWYVECKFIGLDGVSQVVTNRAKITVTAPATATPRPTEAPTPTPEAEETAETGAVKGLAGDAHEHSFDQSWSCDAQQHWKECSCGERGEEGSHRLSWTVTREAGARTAGEREGVCDDCGFTVTETIEPQEEAGSKKGAAEPAGDEKDSGQALVIVLAAVGGALLAAVVILAVLLAKKSRR